MKKIIANIIGIILIMILLVGCGNPDSEMISSGGAFSDNYYTYVDVETGVNYIIFVAGYKGGICPRYNADGTLYVSEIK